MLDLHGLPARPTRREFLALAGVGLGTIFLPGAATRASAIADGAVSAYRSRPDLSPPSVRVDTSAPSSASGYVFIAPASGPGQHGPLIVDDRGEPVWFHPVDGVVAQNFRAQRYGGAPVLTWWEGEVTHGYGRGDYVIADSSYRQIKRFAPANGYPGDLHEFTLTSSGSALVSVYHEVAADLSAYGGPSAGTLLEGIVQEIDLRSGTLLFEWHSHDHVSVAESYRPTNGGLWDYFHLNSIDELEDGNLLVSARHTSAVYKLDRRSGEVIWRLGGKRSDFELGPGATFAFQHDARGHPGGLVSIFDDGAYSDGSAIEPTSRAILLAIDTTAMTARLERADANPQGALATAMGSAQVLPDGGMFAGWGTVPSCSEFSRSGELRFDASLTGGGVSYRAFRDPWQARPRDLPALAVEPGPARSLDVYASWNGATEVTHWRILGGAGPATLAPLRTLPRTGFETAVRLETAPPLVCGVALDGQGRALATSPMLRT